MKKLLKEFKTFIMKGNVLDLAVGVIIGAAFGKIVASLVNDVIMPVITLLTGGRNVNSLYILLGDAKGAVINSIEDAKAAGVSTLNYGMFIQTVIDFLIIAFFIFLFVKAINNMRKKDAPAPAPAPAPRLCPFCKQPVDKEATRCPHCTSELKKA